MVRISQRMREALVVLSDGEMHDTSTSTTSNQPTLGHRGTIDGVTATALERRGLVETGGFAPRKVWLTDVGKMDCRERGIEVAP